jgi:hypothetical protein
VVKTVVGATLLFISPLGEHMRYTVCLHFPTSNNMAEYEALLCGLRIAIETCIKCLDVRGDSQLVIDQVTKNASCHDDKMEAYATPYEPLKTSSTASSSTTFPTGTTRRRTISPRLRQGESPFPKRLYMGCRETVRQPRANTLEPIRTLGSSLESRGRGAYGRGPLE